MPGDEDAGAGSVFGLGEQIGGDESRRRRGVGQNDDLARTRDAIDGHLPEDVALGQGHEQIARPDNHVHRRQSVDAVS